MIDLVSVAKLIMGQSPPSSSYNDLGKGLPFYQGKTDFGYIHPTPRKYCTDPKKVAETGDILISVRAPVGPVNITNSKACIGRGIAAIRAIKIDQSFLYFDLIFQEAAIASLGTGSTFKAINKSQLENIKIPEFPFPEQRKIAYVLSTVQKAIKKQDLLIKTTTELKKALMQKLFTEGLHGEPQKETEIGLVPESWDVVKLDEVCDRITINVEPKKNGETPYVGLEHITPGRIRLNNCGKESEVVSSKAKFNSGEILYGKLRPYLDKAVLAHIGGMCSTDILVFTGKKGVINDFLIHLFHTDKLIDFAKSTTTGVQHPRTSWNSLKKLIIGLPKKEERIETTNALNTIEDKLEFHEKKKQTLTALFKSLLHELMTGRRRVHELEFEGIVREYKQKGQPLSIAAEE